MFQEEIQIYRVNLHDENPMPEDHPALALEAARWVAGQVRFGNRVLITCAAGLNRSGFVSALALWLLTGKPGTQIVEHIRAHRDDALMNPSFASYIERLPAR